MNQSLAYCHIGASAPIWKRPQPFVIDKESLPSFPTDCLPSVVCEFVKDAAIATSTDEAMAATARFISVFRLHSGSLQGCWKARTFRAADIIYAHCGRAWRTKISYNEICAGTFGQVRFFVQRQAQAGFLPEQGTKTNTR